MEFELSDRLQKMMEVSKAEKQALLKKNEELQQIKNEMGKITFIFNSRERSIKNQTQKQASQII